MNERIRQLRRALDLTQQQFADKLGVARNNIAGYEIGNRNPSDAVVSLICREFNVNEDWLRTGNGEMFIEQSRDEEIAGWVGRILSDESAEFKRRVIGALSRMNESGWDELEKFLNDLQNNKS